MTTVNNRFFKSFKPLHDLFDNEDSKVLLINSVTRTDYHNFLSDIESSLKEDREYFSHRSNRDIEYVRKVIRSNEHLRYMIFTRVNHEDVTFVRELRDFIKDRDICVILANCPDDGKVGNLVMEVDVSIRTINSIEVNKHRSVSPMEIGTVIEY